MKSRHLFLAFALLLAGCAEPAAPAVTGQGPTAAGPSRSAPDSAVPATTAAPTEATLPAGRASAAAASTVPIHTPPKPAAPTLRASPTCASVPRPTASPAPVPGTAWSQTTEGILVAYGENDLLTLAQVDSRGGLHVLAEPRRMLADCWTPPHLSPDGTLLAYYLPGFPTALVLYNLKTRQEQITRPPGASMTVPVFDAAGQRIAYTATIGDWQGWAIYLRDIATGQEATYLGPVVGQGQEWDEPLPGNPIAWVGNELFVDCFIPWQETVNWGIRVLDLTNGVAGETRDLKRYDRRLLDPKDMRYWNPTLSPDGDLLAFVIWGYDYAPMCYAGYADDGIAFGVGIVPTTGGPPQILVDASRQDGAVTDQPLAWSPDGKQILFAQASCQNASSALEPVLRAVSLEGVVTHEWPLARIGYYTACQEAQWCTPEQIFYKRSYPGEQDQLWWLNVETGQTEQVLSSSQIRLIGCFP